MEPREPVSGFETRAGLGGGGLEGGGAHVGCVKRRISDTINHTLSDKSKFFFRSYRHLLGNLSP